MIPVDVETIKIAVNRQRREFTETEHQNLITSLQGPAGLLHPVVVRETPEGMMLVAGERRLRAVKEIYQLNGRLRHDNQAIEQGFIPVVTLGELAPLDAMEAEFEENIRRVDLTWPERAKATAGLLELRQLQYAANGGDKPPSAVTVAEELGRGDHVLKEIRVARHLDDPDIANASSVQEAHKVLIKKEERAKNERLAAQVGRTHNATSHTLHHGEAHEWMQACPAGKFDVICTDPPYGMGADQFGDSGSEGTGVHTYADDEDNLISILQWFSPESFRVTKDNAHLYLFCDIKWFALWKDSLELAGWKVFRTPLVWNKVMGFRAPWPEQGPKRSYELIVFAVKGDKKVTSLQSDVITAPPVSGLGHPAAKPVELMRNLLGRSCQAGEKVLDPFAGSGSTIEAAHGMKLLATGIERDANYYGVALKRLGEMR